MPQYTIESPRASAYYELESKIVFVTYQGELTADDSSAVYTWLNKLIQEIGIESIYGEIFDFRQVTEFMRDNLMDARKKSRGLNLRNPVQSFPVAMIVKDFYQEEILRGPMQNVPENIRKRIVQTPAEARAFLDEWHTLRTQEAEAE